MPVKWRVVMAGCWTLGDVSSPEGETLPPETSGSRKSAARISAAQAPGRPERFDRPGCSGPGLKIGLEPDQDPGVQWKVHEPVPAPDPAAITGPAALTGPGASLPPGWSSREAVPARATPLGRMNALAMTGLACTVPSTILDPPIQPGQAEQPAQTGPGACRGLDVVELRARLLLRSTPDEVRDRAWRYIARRARTDRGDWNLFALGVAYPGLRQRARKLTENVSARRAEQVHYDLATEFLFALHRLNLDTPSLISRLVGAAYDQASGRKRRPEPIHLDLDLLTDADQLAWDRTGAAGGVELDGDQDGDLDGDPRMVLARLVTQTRTARRSARLSEHHAALIAGTYLEGRKLYEVAAELNLSPANASKHRAHAETLIAGLLGYPRRAGRPLT
jgi:DNA-directed RNA polymerase specialized sigma24 family protein